MTRSWSGFAPSAWGLSPRPARARAATPRSAPPRTGRRSGPAIRAAARPSPPKATVAAHRLKLGRCSSSKASGSLPHSSQMICAISATVRSSEAETLKSSLSPAGWRIAVVIALDELYVARSVELRLGMEAPGRSAFIARRPGRAAQAIRLHSAAKPPTNHPPPSLGASIVDPPAIHQAARPTAALHRPQAPPPPRRPTSSSRPPRARSCPAAVDAAPRAVGRPGQPSGRRASPLRARARPT